MSYERTSSYRQQERIFKIIVIGDTSVGKTCLSCRFCDGKFPNSEATIGVDFREKSVRVDDETIKLQLWDTAGQERFRLGIVSHYYRKAHAVVFVYDVTSMETFKNLTHWLDEFQENHKNDSDVAKILVGNKCDCDTQKAVSTSMAQKFADSYNMPLFETSAADEKEGDTINAIFMTLAHKLKNQKPLMLPPLRESSVKVTMGHIKTNGNDSYCC